MKLVFRGLLMAVFFANCSVFAGDGENGKTVDQAQARHANVPFATVNGEVISLSEYMMALREQARRKFYHGKPAESQLQSFSKDVADQLVDRQLLLQEAAVRGIVVSDKDLDREVNALRSRYSGAAAGSGSEHSQEVFWQALRVRLSEEMVLKRFREDVHNQVRLTEGEVVQYYKDNPDKFTEPEQQRLSLLLLGVDPSSPKEVWSAAEAEAINLAEKITGGESFADLAALHSSDKSAGNGGDLGYVHLGVMGDELQKVLDELPLETVSEPIRTLEGYALFIVGDRKPAVLHSFERVKERANKLALRDGRDNAWKHLTASLRESATIEINEEYVAQVNLVSH